MSTPAQSSSPSPDRATWHLPQLEHWIIVPLIVVLAIGAIGRIVSLTPEVGAAESQVNLVLTRINNLVSEHPKAAAYTPGEIL